MKPTLPALAATVAACCAAVAQSGNYVNFIRQTVLDTNPPIYYDVQVEKQGQRVSAMPVLLAGSRYELWTVKSGSTPASHLLDTTYVSAYAPEAEITIHTEDPDGQVPRTRADRPFSVDAEVRGLLNGLLDPPESKSVRFLRHVQSYGDGDGSEIDRSQATLHSQAVISRNGTTTLNYDLTAVPGPDRLRVRGEERFSIYTRKSDGSIDQQLATATLQVWPVATASIAGIEEGETMRFQVPTITVTARDLYPKSYTYAQVYRGAPRLGENGEVMRSAQLVLDQQTPETRVWTARNYGNLLTEDGQWTIEVVTQTVFGTERLAHVSFEVDRAIEVNSTLGTYGSD